MARYDGMTYYSIWPYFICMAGLLGIAATPLFKAADTPPSDAHAERRILSLDGLRGFLALGVFFLHATMFYRYYTEGRWEEPPQPFYISAGQSGVALFFMITGYLFWSRMIEEKGKPDWLRLYTGRFFRIYPLYLFLVAALLAILFTRNGLHLQVPASRLAEEILLWLVPGLRGEINGYDTLLITSGVTWTLKYESLFYASLLLTAWAARSARTHLPFAAGGFFLLVVSLSYTDLRPSMVYGSYAVLLFFSGMTCASLEKNNIIQRLPDRLSSILVLLLLGLVTFAFDTVCRAAPLIMLAIVFYFIVTGCTVFGLLTLRASRRLGDVSYGIYLLQGIVTALLFSCDGVRSYAVASPLRYWEVTFLAALLLIALATLAHVGIERPGIRLGKRIAAIWPKSSVRPTSRTAVSPGSPDA